MTFILDMTIGAAVWAPYTIGKTLALNFVRGNTLILAYNTQR